MPPRPLFFLLKNALLPIAGGFLAVTLFSALPSADAQGAPGIVTAREFRLVDATGVVRALIEVDKNGEARLMLADPAGKPRAVLGAAAGQAALVLRDARGTVRYFANQTEADDGVKQAFLDRAGKERIVSAVTRKQDTLIGFLGPKGGNWMSLIAGPEQATSLVLQDPKSQQRVVCFAGRGQATVQTSDVAGKSGFLGSTLQDGRSLLAVSYAGVPRMRVLTAADGTPELALFDAARKKTWEAGK